MIKKYFVKVFFGAVFLSLAVAVSYGSFFAWKIYSTEKKVSLNVSRDQSFFETMSRLTRKKEPGSWTDKERLNVLLLGIAGEKRAGQNLTDTVMIASINLKTSQAALISIPRDLYVQISDDSVSMKINSVYPAALNSSGKNKSASAEKIRETVSKITSLEIDHYVILDFAGFEKIIDAIGGINVMNENDIFDPKYPGPNYSYETFELKKGLHHLDGRTALKYARERHNDPEGDFGRAKRQQKLLQAVKNRVFSARTLLNVFALNDLFDVLGENIKTDIEPEKFEDFIELAWKIDTENVGNVVVSAWDKESILRVSHIFEGENRAFVLVPRVGNWSELQELCQNVFDINKIRKRREEIALENATVALVNKSGDLKILEKIRNLLKENLRYKNIIILNETARNTEENTRVYDLTEGQKPFTLDELFLKLPARISTDIEEDYEKIIEGVKTDLVVIIGKDLIERYNMEEDSIEEYRSSKDSNEYSEFRN